MEPTSLSDLQGNIKNGPATNDQWIYDSPIHSDVEGKLKQLLFKLRSDNRIVGIQVCAYKDGEVIIDTAAGVLGRDDPRPVQHDSLFPVFSVTKGITAGMLHWLVDNGKLKLDENVANIWPGFGINQKDLIKVHHVLNHTSGLHNAMADVMADPLLMSDWEECLKRTAMSVPESEPGHEQLYHYSSFGYLCGGIIEHASGKKFLEVLNEAIVHPLNIEGELYIGIPPGVESRLASLSVAMEDFKLLQGNISRTDLPSSFQPAVIAKMVPILAGQYNTLNVRQAIVPSANGHCTARALARYYAALAAGGIVPPPHSPFSKPPLGSHLHTPQSPSLHPEKRGSETNEAAVLNDRAKTENQNHNFSTDARVASDSGGSTKTGISKDCVNRIFHNAKIHDAFLGVGDFENLALPNGLFGLGFKRYASKDGLTSFGHSGLGGSIGFCDMEHKFAIAVIVNNMSLGIVTGIIVQMVCSELNVPVPHEFARFGETGSDGQPNSGNPLIN